MRPDHERAFWEAIQEAPDDDTPRLVYADWLEDHGQPERAEFIRAQIELEGLGIGDPRRAVLEDRADDLLARHEMDWLGPAGELDSWEWRRGFVERVHVHSATLEPARPQFERHPVREAEVDMGRVEVGRMIESPFLERMEGMTRQVRWGEEDRQALFSLLASPRLSRLAELDVSMGEVGGLLAEFAVLPSVPALQKAHVRVVNDEDARAIMSSPSLTGLNEVGGHEAISTRALATLLRNPERWLGLHLGLGGLRAPDLANLQACGALRRLAFRWPVEHRGPLPLPRSLEELTVEGWPHHTPAPVEVARTVAGMPLRQLEYRWTPANEAASAEDWEGLGELFSGLPGPVLDLTLSGFADDPLPAFVRLPGLENIHRLEVYMSPASDEGVDALAACSRLAGLRWFRSEMRWSPEQVARLAGASWLGGLRSLSLFGTYVGDTGVIALLSSAGLRRLRTLELMDASITPAAIEALLSWPCLQGLRRLGLEYNRLATPRLELFQSLLGVRVAW